LIRRSMPAQLAHRELALEELREIIDMRARLFGGFAGAPVELCALAKGKMQLQLDRTLRRT
jgi:hypothetical protein